nr:TAL effector repeat-containing protein [Paraburkholderia terricola]
MRPSSVPLPDDRLNRITSARQATDAGAARAASFSYSPTARSDVRRNPLGLSRSQLENVCATNGGHLTLAYIDEHHATLTDPPYSLGKADIVKIATNNGAAQAFHALQELHTELRNLGYEPADLVAIAANNGGAQALRQVRWHRFTELAQNPSAVCANTRPQQFLRRRPVNVTAPAIDSQAAHFISRPCAFALVLVVRRCRQGG